MTFQSGKKNQGLKTHYQGAGFTERVWPECKLWCKTQTSIIVILASVRAEKMPEKCVIFDCSNVQTAPSKGFSSFGLLSSSYTVTSR